jgi:hypothetical protein
MRPSSWLTTVAAFALIATLIGCGGTTNSTPTGGGTGGGPLPNETQGTARVDVNTETGAVKVTPLGKGNQTNSLYTGSALSITSSSLSTDPGEITLKKLKLTIANNTTDTIEGGRMIFDTVSSDVGGSLDLRPFTSVSTIVGPGSSANDGPGPSVTINQPTGIASAPDGSVFLAGSGDGTLRRLQNDFVTRIATGIASPGGVAVLGSSVFMLEQSAHNLVRVPTTGGNKFVLAGNGAAGFADGSGAAAQFSSPRDIEIIGTTAFIADLANDKIRTATNLTGGSAIVATLNVFPAITSPSGLASFTQGGVNWLVVTSSATHKIHLVNSANGQSFVIAGTGVLGSTNGLGTVAQFNTPFDATFSNGAIFVSDLGGRTIRQLSLSDGALPQFASSWTVKTVAGTGANGAVDGNGATAQFGSPRFLETDNSGGLLLGDLTNNRIRTVSPVSGVFPVTGSGGTGSGQVEVIGVDGYLPDPLGTRKPFCSLPVFAPKGGAGSSRDKEISFTIASGVKSFFFIISVSGSTSSTPAALDAVSNSGVGDSFGSPNVAVRTLSGQLPVGWADGDATVARYGNSPFVAASKIGYFVSDGTNANIRFVDFNGTATTIAGIGGASHGGSAAGGNGATCSFASPAGIWSNEDGNLLYVCDVDDHVIMRLQRSDSNITNPLSWTVSIIAGIAGSVGNNVGDGVTARFAEPLGITADSTGRRVLVGDSANHCVKVLDLIGNNPGSPDQWGVGFYAGSTSGVSGNVNANGTAARFTEPGALALSKTGDVYVCEQGGFRVRRIAPSGDVSAVAGAIATTSGMVDGFGAVARFTSPSGIALDDAGYAYVSDALFVRRISLTTFEVKTVAGRSDIPQIVDGAGNTASFSFLVNLDYDPQRGVIFSDNGRFGIIERTIRQGLP